MIKPLDTLLITPGNRYQSYTYFIVSRVPFHHNISQGYITPRLRYLMKGTIFADLRISFWISSSYTLVGRISLSAQ